MRLLKIVLALAAPPLAVLWERGLGTSLLLNVLLTILGWLPGAIHALVVVLGHHEPMPAAVRA